MVRSKGACAVLMPVVVFTRAQTESKNSKKPPGSRPGIQQGDTTAPPRQVCDGGLFGPSSQSEALYFQESWLSVNCGLSLSTHTKAPSYDSRGPGAELVPLRYPTSSQQPHFGQPAISLDDHSFHAVRFLTAWFDPPLTRFSDELLMGKEDVLP